MTENKGNTKMSRQANNLTGFHIVFKLKLLHTVAIAFERENISGKKFILITLGFLFKNKCF